MSGALFRLLSGSARRNAQLEGGGSNAFWRLTVGESTLILIEALAVILLLWELSSIRSGNEADQIGRQQERAYGLVLKGFEADFVEARQNLFVTSGEYSGSLPNALRLLGARPDNAAEYRDLSSDTHRVLTYLEVVATCFRSGACDPRLQSIAKETYGDSARLLCPLIEEMRLERAPDVLPRSYHKDFERFFGSCGENPALPGATL